MSDPFYERIHEWSFGRPTDLLSVSIPDRRKVEAQAIEYRTWLRKSHRFVLEPDFTRTMAEMSRDLRRLPLWVQLARLPYDAVFIEWNIGVINSVNKTNLIRGFDEDFDLRNEPVGYLLVRDPASSTKWMAVQFVLVDDRVMPGMLAFVFDPEGSAANPVRGAFGRPTLSLDPMLRGAVEPWSEGMAMLATREPDTGQIAVPLHGWFEHRVGVLVEPIWRSVLLQGDLDQQGRRDELRRYLTDALVDESGILRKLSTSLALLNDVPVLERIDVRRGGFRSVRFKRLPYLGHTSIELALPKRANKVRQLQRYLNRAAVTRSAMRAHEVRGHFRRVSRRAAGLVCQHVAMHIDQGIGLCQRCGEQIRWIPSFQRGDAGIGFVSKTEYRLKSS